MLDLSWRPCNLCKDAAPVPFVYAASSGATAPANGGSPSYRIGGIDFADRAIAERVRDDIRDALKPYDQEQANRGQSRGSARLVSLKPIDPAELKRLIDLNRERIKMIAETAGLSYMMLVDGC